MKTTAAIAIAFMKRSSELGYKGKARDRAALDYIVGAAKARELAGLALEGLDVMALIVSIRGFDELARFAKTDE